MSNSNQLLVKKRGGDNATKLEQNSNLIIADQQKGKLQALVISAMRDDIFNTTDNLIKICNKFTEGDYISAYKYLEEIKRFHVKTIETELIDYPNIKVSTLARLDDMFDEFKNILERWQQHKAPDSKLPLKSNDYSIEVDDKRYSIIGFGEVVAAQLNEFVLNQKAELIDILQGQEKIAEAVNLNHLLTPEESEGKSEREIFAILFQKLADKVDGLIKDNIIPVLPGYVGVFPDGIENAVGRGYTDATAGALTVGLKHRNPQRNITLEIQKAVQGILSTDPRILSNPDNAKVIDKLDYLFARELIGARGAQAKVLHHQSMRSELLKAGIKIHLQNPFNPESPGSWVTPEGDTTAEGVQYIGGRKNVNFVTISGDNMGKGYLHHVMELVSKYVSVDIVGTSETEISFTYDCSDEDKNGCFIDMVNELESKYNINGDTGPKMNFVEATGDRALVFCIGQNMKSRAGLMSRAAGALARQKISLEIVSQGMQQRAMVFGVEAKHLQKAIQALHFEFIEKNNNDDIIIKIEELLKNPELNNSVRKILKLEKSRLEKKV